MRALLTLAAWLAASACTFTSTVDLQAREADAGASGVGLGRDAAPLAPDSGAPDAGAADLDATAIGLAEVGESPLDAAATSGWDDPPATGATFAVRSMAMAPDSVGFDLDGDCLRLGRCIDNALAVLEPSHGGFVRANAEEGEYRILVEVAGLDVPFRGNDEDVTVKLYAGRDFDDPRFPANDFETPPGETTCCQFVIDPLGVAGTPPQARSRSPATLTRAQLGTRVSLPLTIRDGRARQLRLERVRLVGRMTSTSSLTQVLMGAVLPAAGLGLLDDGGCAGETCVDGPDRIGWEMVRLRQMQPDIDLDGDGLETFSFAGGSVACFDGCGAACPIPPLDADPASCRLDPRMADGYSVAFLVDLAPVQVMGVR